jgi:hypothetical protein
MIMRSSLQRLLAAPASLQNSSSELNCMGTKSQSAQFFFLLKCTFSLYSIDRVLNFRLGPYLIRRIFYTSVGGLESVGFNFIPA